MFMCFFGAWTRETDGIAAKLLRCGSATAKPGTKPPIKKPQPIKKPPLMQTNITSLCLDVSPEVLPLLSPPLFPLLSSLYSSSFSFFVLAFLIFLLPPCFYASHSSLFLPFAKVYSEVLLSFWRPLCRVSGSLPWVQWPSSTGFDRIQSCKTSFIIFFFGGGGGGGEEAVDRGHAGTKGTNWGTQSKMQCPQIVDMDMGPKMVVVLSLFSHVSFESGPPPSGTIPKTEGGLGMYPKNRKL